MMRISNFQMKDVINVADGKKLGFISDIDIDVETGKIDCIFISQQNKMLPFFNKLEDIVIEWGDILKIGEDVILVRFPHQYQLNEPKEEYSNR
ncbi:YlmC/YmxH family sporulation protein [Cytobacillus sp. FSL R7-0696]|uniref:YlmC/YmxH family sporulation protein n=1 Tax=Cytobacillus sp. FSL R7-0696 TaxID=2921691 RepID=UPI0030FCC5B3